MLSVACLPEIADTSEQSGDRLSFISRTLRRERKREACNDDKPNEDGGGTIGLNRRIYSVSYATFKYY